MMTTGSTRLVSTKWFWFLVVLLLPQENLIQAQESPRWFYRSDGTISDGTAPMFDEAAFNASLHRQDVCKLHHDFVTGVQPDLRYALEGVEIHPLVRVGEFFRLDEETGGIDEDDPGLMAILLDELAKRGKFSWRNSYAAFYEPGNNHTWTELLEWGAEVYDFHADWWTEVADRMRLGIFFPYGFLDSSLILVGHKPQEEAKTDFWSLIKPFDTGVWLSIFGTIFLSGIVYSILAYLDHMGAKERGSESEGVGPSLYNSFLVFTQHFQFEPRSFATGIFSISLAFWAMVIVATYTANLASFFVVQNTATVRIDGIDDAIQARMPLCVWEGTSSDLYTEKQYPKDVFIKKKIEETVLQGVIDGECTFAVLARSSWERLEMDSTVNSHCTLEWVGRVIDFARAGFALKTDAGTKCSSLVHHVLHVHMIEMTADGFIEKAYENAMRKSQDINCKILEANENEDKSGTLRLKELAGPFLLHGIITVVALVISVAMMLKRQHLKPRIQFQTPSAFGEFEFENKNDMGLSGTDKTHISNYSTPDYCGLDACVSSLGMSNPKLMNEAMDQVAANALLGEEATQVSMMMNMIEEMKEMNTKAQIEDVGACIPSQSSDFPFDETKGHSKKKEP